MRKMKIILISFHSHVPLSLTISLLNYFITVSKRKRKGEKESSASPTDERTGEEQVTVIVPK